MTEQMDAPRHPVPETPQKHVPSAYDTASGTPVRARIGTVYFDPETNEYVMPPDFAGDDELRLKADVSQMGNFPAAGNIDKVSVATDPEKDTTTCDCEECREHRCDEAAKATESVINEGPSRWHYAAGHWREDGRDWYDVREVYSFGHTERPMEPFSESLTGLSDVLRMMLDDVGKYPVVEVDDD